LTKNSRTFRLKKAEPIAPSRGRIRQQLFGGEFKLTFDRNSEGCRGVASACFFDRISVDFLPDLSSKKAGKFAPENAGRHPTFLRAFFWRKKVEDLPGQEPGVNGLFLGKNSGKFWPLSGENSWHYQRVSVVSVGSGVARYIPSRLLLTGEQLGYDPRTKTQSTPQ